MAMRPGGTSGAVRLGGGMDDWFDHAELAAGVVRTTEPFVNDWFRANIYTVQGRDRDLVFDFGCGMRPLRPALPLSGKPVVAVASHAHVDHVGGFHDFEMRLAHAAEAEGYATMSETATLKHLFGAPPHGPAVDRAPFAGFDRALWDLVPAPLTGTLAEGDRIDLGDRVCTVLHLPGHSPGGIGLLDEVAGLLLAGDAVYEGELLDTLPGSSIPEYRATMQRLAGLDCALVLAGHGPGFDGARLRALALAYLEKSG